MRKLETTLRTMRTLWAAFASSVGLLVYAAIFLKPKYDQTRIPFGIVAVAGALSWIASIVLPKVREKATFASLTFAVHEEASEIEDGFRASLGNVRVLTDPDAAFSSYMRRYPLLFIMELWLAELTCLCGFVAAGTDQRGWEIVPFALAAWVSMLMKFPRRKALIAGLERVSGAAYRDVAKG